jgi:hypothetical protein
MRLSSLAAARPAYYDRNPVPIFKYWTESFGPASGGGTQVVIYTVPAGKLFLLAAYSAYYQISTALATPGTDGITLVYRINTGSGYANFHIISDNNTALNYVRGYDVSTSIVFKAGTIIQTLNQRTIIAGGAASLTGNIQGTEFDV